MLTFCPLMLLSPDKLCVEVIFVFLLYSSYSLLIMLNTFCNRLTLLAQAPIYIGVKKCPAVSGQSVFFSIFVSKINVVRQSSGFTLFRLIKDCFSFDREWISPHNNIWAYVELSFRNDSFRTKNSKWSHKIKKIIITFSIVEMETWFFHQTIYFCH